MLDDEKLLYLIIYKVLVKLDLVYLFVFKQFTQSL